LARSPLKARKIFFLRSDFKIGLEFI